MHSLIIKIKLAKLQFFKGKLSIDANKSNTFPFMLIICSILNRLKEKNTTCCLELATMFKLTSENVSLNINGCCMLLKLFYKLYHNESLCFLWKEYKCRMLGLNIPNELISKQKKNIFKLNCTETICRLQLLTP